MKSHSDHELEVGWVLNPELLNQHAGEDEFISEKYNVSLVKHPRYLPVFYHEHDFLKSYMFCQEPVLIPSGIPQRN